MTKSYIPIILSLFLCLEGCVGARPNLTFETSKYPISLSGSLLSERNKIVGPDELFPVGRFKFRDTAYAMGYSYIPLGKSDLSKEVNQQVAEAKGEAIVNLQVLNAKNPGCLAMSILQLTGAAPIFVGCTTYEVIGDIVRMKKTAKR